MTNAKKYGCLAVKGAATNPRANERGKQEKTGER